MSTAPAIIGLHLRYRLWIAEMNFDINVLRIFVDYIRELSGRNEESEVVSGFRQRFGDVRKEIDDLRHEMHLHKMALASISREGKQPGEQAHVAREHEALKGRYMSFRKKMETLKRELEGF